MTDSSTVMEGTLLTKRWFERRGENVLEFWVATPNGPLRVEIRGERSVLFVPRGTACSADERREVELHTLDGDPVDALYFRSQRTLVDAKNGLMARGGTPLEADISPADRFLMERFVTGTLRAYGHTVARDGFVEMVNPTVRPGDVPCSPRILSFDIETQGLDGRVISIAAVCGDQERVWVDLPDSQSSRFIPCAGEGALLSAFEAFVRQADPDVLTGWNVVGFDLRVLLARAKLAGVSMRLGRAKGTTSLRDSTRRSGTLADVEGRVVLDARQVLQASGYAAESFALEAVAQDVLGHGKAIATVSDKAAEIMRMYHEEPDQLAHYNLVDARLVAQIFDRRDLLGFVLERQQLTGLAMDRIGGSVAAFDYLYLPRLHRRGAVARTIDSDEVFEPSPGGYVMDSVPGLFGAILVLDFKSLYPSIIRTFKIDPFGLSEGLRGATHRVEGFKGAIFSRDEHILPELIEELWAARDEAKRRGDHARSTAIKVLMNSFYGVLGTTGCRFYDPRLASSITMRGHQIIQDTRAFIHAQGFEVIYGDTDSLFVRAGDVDDDACQAIGHTLAAGINAYWRDRCQQDFGIVSSLEIQFETAFSRFFMPTKRHSDEGSKKRYAGWVRRPDGAHDVVVKGLEAARADWTPLAREFQLEVLRRVFGGQISALPSWVTQVVESVRSGDRDAELVYTKRVRRSPEDYVATPPHVAAAKLLGGNPRRVSYVVTRVGPRPVGMVDAPLDYDHYVDKQLKPAVQGILEQVGLDFDALTARQQTLF